MRREKRNIDEVVKRRVVKRRQREWYSAQYLFHCSCLIVYIISLVVGTLCGMQHLKQTGIEYSSYYSSNASAVNCIIYKTDFVHTHVNISHR